ncbi:MAG: cytochrome c oxidase assembly factor 1 family protein [Blastocatellia bacterium]|nr:cytochrome c oxidase assembly factor 1 family protein [Blastocatellia bacterium]
MQPQPQKNWWGRNWKWFVPTGCLTMLLACAGFVTLIFSIVLGSLKSSDVYNESLAKARTNAQVTAALGTPVEPGFWVSGNISVENSSGNADLSIPISGPNGSGTIYVTATKSAGRWNYSTMICEISSSGNRVNLLTSTP